MSKIIYVEDTKDTANAVKLILEGAGHKVDLAYTGADGLEKMKSEAYDIAILDIMLPDMSGIDVFTKARTAAKNKDCKYVFLSILPIPQKQLEALKRKGVEEHISKPFENDALLKKINSIAAGAKRTRSKKPLERA